MAKRSRSSRAKQTGKVTSQAPYSRSKASKRNRKLQPATTSFVEDVRRAISDGEFDRAEIGNAGPLSMLQKKSLRYEQMQRKSS